MAEPYTAAEIEAVRAAYARHLAREAERTETINYNPHAVWVEDLRWLATLDALRARCEGAEEALRFYAYAESWAYFGTHSIHRPVNDDAGTLARAHLGRYGEKA